MPEIIPYYASGCDNHARQRPATVALTAGRRLCILFVQLQTRLMSEFICELSQQFITDIWNNNVYQGFFWSEAIDCCCSLAVV